MQLGAVLEALRAPLSEQQLWSVCYHACALAHNIFLSWGESEAVKEPIYATPDHIELVSPGQLKLVTCGIFAIHTWEC